MEINFFNYAGKSSKDFEAYISGTSVFNTPERDISLITVPGRNGDLVQDNGRWRNISISYPAFIYRDFKTNSQRLKEWISSVRGYNRLEDTYFPEYFRMAVFTGGLNFKLSLLNRAGEFDISFNCKPQKFLKQGEIPVDITSGGLLNNQWLESLPIIKISGSGAGQITIKDTTVRINDIAENMVIDCELQNAYAGNINLNSKIELNNYEFPTLQPGENKIIVAGGITKAEIIPRWWTI